MDYLFMALAVFTVVRFVQLLVDGPAWLWQLVTVALSALVIIPWDVEWYAFLAIAGVVSFLQMLENLLIAKADEALSGPPK